MPETFRAVIDRRAWEPLPIFRVMQEIGNVPVDEMYRTFNMGVGMVIIATGKDAPGILRSLSRRKLKSAIIGHIEKKPPRNPARLIYS